MAASMQLEPERVSVSGRRRKTTAGLDADLEWFLVCGSAALRERGTTGAVISVLELGGPNRGGVPNSDLYNDQQVGFGRHTVGDVERVRWLMSAWNRLDVDVQRVLIAYHLAPRAEFRGDQGFGARDRCPPCDDDANLGTVKEPQRGSHVAVHTGIEAQLGEFASLAFWLAKDPARLAAACKEPSRKDGKAIVARALREAKVLMAEAQRAWLVAKTGKPRLRRERVAIGARHVRSVEGETE